MNTTKYFPAMGAGTQKRALTINYCHSKTNQTYRLYKENSVFHHDHILFSAGHLYNEMDWVKQIDLDLNKTTLLGDSGGYQIMTGELDFKPELIEKIFNWLENNTTYAVNIDIPPFINLDNTPKSKFKNCNFQEKLDISLTNFRYFESHQTGKTKFMNVIHGKTIDEISKWYDAVKDFNFPGGWAVGSVTKHPFYILQSLFFLWQNGEFAKHKNNKTIFHILGFSKYNFAYILYYFQLKLNKLGYTNTTITYDSSSPFKTGSYGEAITFNRKEAFNCISYPLSILRENESYNPDGLLPCNCPVCNGLTYKDLLVPSIRNQESFHSSYYWIIQFHNLYKYLEHKMIIERIIHFENKSAYASIFNTNELKIIELIDKCFDSKKPLDLIQDAKYEIFEKDEAFEDNETLF